MSHGRGITVRGGSRRGFTLVEMLVTMTVASVAMSTAVALLHRALRLESASRRVLERERAALVLGRQFRADIHRAREVVCAGDPLTAGVVLGATTAVGTIDYRAVPGGLERVESRGGRTIREAFPSPPGTRWWAVREGRVVILRAEASAGATTGPPLAVEVAAIVGGADGEPDAEALP